MADRKMTDRERSIADFMYGFGLGDQHAHTEEEYYEMLVECSHCAPEDAKDATIERMRGLLGEANNEAAEQAKIVGRLGEQIDRQAAIASEIRAILAEPVREAVEKPIYPGPVKLFFSIPTAKRLHELLGGDHAAQANREGK